MSVRSPASLEGGVALLFPGQGSQAPGALSRLPEHPAATAVLALARERLGPRRVAALDALEGTPSTAEVQLQLFLVGAACGLALEAAAGAPAVVAGHSVGAVAAAVGCGALTPEEGLAFVERRGALMAAAFPTGFGMAAVRGVPERDLAGLAEALARPDEPLAVAIVNAPDQVVLAGADAALLRLERAGRGEVRRLAVAVPSHTPLLAPVAAELRLALEPVERRSLRCAYLGNARARVLTDAEAVLEDLAASVATPLRFADGIVLLAERGVGGFLEVPPGRVLTHLAAALAPGASAVALEDAGYPGALSWWSTRR